MTNRTDRTNRYHENAIGREKTPKDPANKGPYRSPTLTKHGAFRDLTTGGSGSAAEGSPGGSIKRP
jgi:hypothetical protein